MPTDALTYALCASELNNQLKCGKINKITMPHPDTLMLNIRAGGQNRLLVLSANPSSPRLHLTTKSLPSPPVAPSFLMHLRKHVGSGTIEEISATDFERIITIHIRANNELMIAESKRLIIEIMGKHSNIILVNENGIISESIKHITADVSSKRQVLAGLPYNPPPAQTEKINIAQTKLLKEKLTEFSGGNLEKYLLGVLCGLSLTTIREAIFRALEGRQDVLQLADSDIDKIITVFSELYDFSMTKPCIQKNEEKYCDFFISPYESCKNDGDFSFFNTLNEAMDAYYSMKSNQQANSTRQNMLLSIIKNALTKSQKKLVTLEQKKQDSLDCDEDRKKGDLILSYIYKIKKGDKEVTVEDYYNDNRPIVIQIDQHKSPQANAQLFYKSYTKKKTALEKLDTFITELNESIEYLGSLSYFAETLESEEQYAEINDELTKLGYVKNKASSKKDKDKKQPKFDSVVYEGYKIFIGKSSISNDMLVKKSLPEFVWLHASGIHGSHVVIENHSLALPKTEVLVYAAQIAAYYSKAKLSENVPVDYTFVSNVKKPKGAALGKVIFTGQKTLYVTPKKPFFTE